MSILSEPKHAESFVVSQGPWMRSKDEVTILAGSGSARELTAGMVLGRRLSGTAAAVAGPANVGNGVFGAVTVSAGARPGKYRVVMVEPASDAGAFVLEDPDGSIIGEGNVAAAYALNGLAFTLADGATDFAAGDFFTITVVPTAEKWLRHAPGATTGEQIAAGILRDDVTAADAVDAKAVVITRDAEVNGAELTYSASADAAAKALANRDLEKVGIIVRAGA